MPDKSKSFSRLPSVMSLQRTVVITDGLMYNLIDPQNPQNNPPVAVIRHGILGTQNTNKTADKNVANLQETETAKLNVSAKGLRVLFELRFLDIETSFSSGVNDPDFSDSVTHFLKRSKDSEALDEIGRRYARNIANGRWLWRNRTLAKNLMIHVSIGEKYDRFDFDGLELPLRHFDDYSDAEKQLGHCIAACLKGESNASIFVQADMFLGVEGRVEVFPSQNYVQNKPNGFARSLYKYRLDADDFSVGFQNENADNPENKVGYAAIRDQKIGNALRTFDTWYDEYDVRRVPISIEPNGADLNTKTFFRNINKKNSAFKLFLTLNTIDPESDEGLFCLANFIRGGVFSEKSESEKENKSKKSKKEE